MNLKLAAKKQINKRIPKKVETILIGILILGILGLFLIFPTLFRDPVAEKSLKIDSRVNFREIISWVLGTLNTLIILLLGLKKLLNKGN